MSERPILNERSVHDPLKTREIRERYFRELSAGLKRAKALVLRTIERNALAFEGPVINAESLGAGALKGTAIEKGRKLQRHAQALVDELLLVKGEELSGAYFARSVQSAYNVGVAFAVDNVQGKNDKLRRALLKLPTHKNAANALAREQVQLLSGLSGDLSKQVRDELVKGLRANKTRAEIAEMIAKRFDIVEHRAKAIAYTEVTKAHAEGSLNAYRSMRFERVTARVEFTLNVHGDAEPCADCIALEDKRYSIDAARGVIPVHPRCQCGWTPVDVVVR